MYFLLYKVFYFKLTNFKYLNTISYRYDIETLSIKYRGSIGYLKLYVTIEFNNFLKFNLVNKLFLKNKFV